MLDSLPVSLNIALFVAAGATVWFAGTRLARYVDDIATETGLERALLGMILLGGITSLPEIAIAVTATLQGTPVLTINDVLGSAAANLVILAVADALIGRDALTSVQGSAHVLLQGTLGIALLGLAIGAGLAGDVLVLGVGVFSWLLLGGYLGSLWLLTRSGAEASWQVSGALKSEEHELTVNDDERQHSLGRLAFKTAAAAAAILLAGFVLTKSADTLAHQTGLGAGFFAVVFLAIATSLPEVSTVFGAVRLRRYEMAISDIFGTNLVNVTIITLVDAMHPGGPVLLEVGRSASVSALMALLLTACFLIGMLERRNHTFLRMGIDSIGVLLIYVAGVALLYTLR